MSKENIIAVLQGIFDGDGFSRKDRGTIGISLSSEILIKQIRIILLNLGIRSMYQLYSKEQMNKYDYFEYPFKHDSHRLELNYSNSKLFYDTIGFRLTRKQNNNLLLIETNTKNGVSKDIIPHSLNMMNVFFNYFDGDISTLRKKYGLNISGVLNKKTRYKSEHTNSRNVDKFYNLVKSKLPEKLIEEYDKIIIPNSEWVQIKDIEEKENKTYDFSLEDTNDFWAHSVIYNGILGHNTPNGMGNFFHRIWSDAETKKNSFETIKLHWSLHPERDQVWRDKQSDELGARMAGQECDCSFLASGNNVVNLITLQEIEKEYVRDPIEVTEGGALWIWERPANDHDYLISADVATGDGSDYSAFHVIDRNTMMQVAEYQDKIGILDYAKILVSVATRYNNAQLVVERESYGRGVLEFILEDGYRNTIFTNSQDLYVEVKGRIQNKYYQEEKKLKPGFSTNEKTRILIIGKLELFINQKHFIPRSVRLINELKTFIWHNGRAEAASGYNDDLCVDGDTLIKTTRGNIPIRDVIIGDNVLTHKGRYKRVSNVFRSYNDTHCIVKCNGKIDLKITPNHPVFYYTGVKSSWSEYINSNSWIKFSDEKVTNVLDLNREGDYYLTTPQINDNGISSLDLMDYANGNWKEENGKLINYIKNPLGEFPNPKQNKISRYIPMDNEFYFILGYFLAEGSKGDHCIQFASNESEIYQREFVKSYMEKYGFKCRIYYNKEFKVCNLVINSTILKNVFLDFSKSSTKKLPHKFETSDPIKNYWLLIGYLSGDGCIYRNTVKSFTISYDIALLIQQCCTNIGIPCHISRSGKSGEVLMMGRKCNVKSGHKIRLPSKGLDFIYNDLKPFKCHKGKYVKSKTINQSFIKILNTKNGNVNLGKIKSIECIKTKINTPFYNLEVEDDNSYVANGTSIHNCMALGIGLWVRDNSLRVKEEGMELTKKMLEKIDTPEKPSDHAPVYSSRGHHDASFDQWNMRVGIGNDQRENLTWLL